MSGKKAKQARKNNGGVKSTRKVVNPVLNGELLDALKFLQDEESKYTFVVAIGDDAATFTHTEHGCTGDYIEENVPAILQTIAALVLGKQEDAGTFGFYTGSVRVQDMVNILLPTVQVIISHFKPSHGLFTTSIEVADGISVQLALDPISPEVMYDVVVPDKYSGSVELLPLAELLHEVRQGATK